MQTTARTIEYSLLKRHFLPMSARATVLRGIGWVDFDELVASFRRFACQLVKERRPCRVRYAFSQAVIVYHPVHVEVLYTDGAELVDNPSAVLMCEVLTTPLRAFVNSSNDLALMMPLFGTFLGFSQLPLSFCNSFLFLAKETRVRDLLPIGECCKRLEPDINTNLVWVLRQSLRFDFTGKTGIPFAGRGSGDSAGFGSPSHRPMKLDLDVPNLGENELPILDLASARDLGKGDAIVSAIAFETWIAWIFTSFYPSEEGLKSKIDTHGHVLQDLGVDILERRPLLFQDRIGLLLLIARDAIASLLIDALAFLKQMVIEPTTLFKRLVEQFLLFLRWEDSILKILKHTRILHVKCRVVNGRWYPCAQAPRKEEPFIPMSEARGFLARSGKQLQDEMIAQGEDPKLVDLYVFSLKECKESHPTIEDIVRLQEQEGK